MKVGILGCTGLVGQTYVSLIQKHPFFEIGFLSASEKNCGLLQNGISISSLDELERAECDLFFSALPSKIAASVETQLAKMGKWVISSSSLFRHMEDVPLIIPEINANHLTLLEKQRVRFGTKTGGIVAKPNCTVQSFLLPLYPLHKAFTLKQVVVTNLQAVSGAGKDLLAHFSRGDMFDTMYPYIANEEEKSETEPLKILETNDISISAHCVRVPLSHGHTSLVNARFKKEVSLDACRSAWECFAGLPSPTAPKHPVYYCEENDRPQPLLDRDREGGMSVTVGRLRKCNIHSIRFTALSHNLIRGAAGGGVLIAECIAEMEQWYDREKSPFYSSC